MNLYHSPYSEIQSDIYEEKYTPDVLGEELKENARVWKTYLDEAKSIDDEMLTGFKETIESLLLFAALFPAVVTAFIITTITSVQPNFTEITAILLVEQVKLLRAAGNSTKINDIPESPVDLQNASIDTNDLWINDLFPASLSLLLAASLLSVLRAMVHQFRYAGLVKWRLTEIVGVLPLILHAYLALFLIGLSLLLKEAELDYLNAVGENHVKDREHSILADILVMLCKLQPN
ncbi:hypothetical protein J3R30DRAFT_3670093 [Lentinula aciculospora]|uniref:DUF6535 domain-containing protein n=1 Tax=Lentinula aciculospora TaxID=153920 RepID=A0A9W9DPU2_9AGAR|nr:hypothetical protein J3R30DRAFT_3670093 [Lentinula aciculospora]